MPLGSKTSHRNFRLSQSELVTTARISRRIDWPRRFSRSPCRSMLIKRSGDAIYARAVVAHYHSLSVSTAWTLGRLKLMDSGTPISVCRASILIWSKSSRLPRPPFRSLRYENPDHFRSLPKRTTDRFLSVLAQIEEMSCSCLPYVAQTSRYQTSYGGLHICHVES